MLTPLMRDPVEPMGVGRVLREPGQTGLGRDIGGQIRRSTVLGDRDDVDDRSGGMAAEKVPDSSLHREERSTQVDSDELIEGFGGGVEEGSPSHQTGAVDESVDAPERLDGLLDRFGRTVGFTDVRLYELCGQVLALE